MSLKKIAKDFEKQLTSSQVQKFRTLVSQSIDMSSKNTSNKANKELAKLQLSHLFEIVKGK